MEEVLGTSDLQPDQTKVVGNLEPTTRDWHLKCVGGPSQGGSVGWSVICALKGYGFDPRLGHGREANNRCFSVTQISLSLSLSLSLSEVNKYILG